MAIKIRKFQMGGGMPPMEDPAVAGAEAGAVAGAEAGAMEQGAPPAEAGAEGGDPVMQLVEMAMQALQAQDPNMAMAVCEGLVGLVQGGGPGGAPAPGGAPEEPVMMRKGGKVSMCKKGKKMGKKKC